MLQAEAPPAAVQPATPAQPAVAVLSRQEGTELVAVLDLPLSLSKGGRTEEALVRRAIFVTAKVQATRPLDGGPDSYAWSYAAFLQRQVCFGSMTGLTGCTEPQVEPLPDKAEGQAAIEPAAEPTFPLAEAARERLVDDLRTRSKIIFDADRRAKVDPIFKAAGVAAAVRAR